MVSSNRTLSNTSFLNKGVGDFTIQTPNAFQKTLPDLLCAFSLLEPIVSPVRLSFPSIIDADE